mgnify:CR=1 FL=1
MEQIMYYIKPELVVVAVVLYFIGVGMKQSEAVKDKHIPLINGLIGIAICALYIFATCRCNSVQEIAMAMFTSITQGILVAGLSTYVNQIFKQAGKKE